MSLPDGDIGSSFENRCEPDSNLGPSMTTTRKRFVLLGAVEDLTEKETFCLKEANFEKAVEVQAKKARLIGELKRLEDHESLSQSEKDEFNSRLDRLLVCENKNEMALEQLKTDNRSQFKTMSKHSSSVSKIRKAYGSASNPDASTPILKGQA